MNLVKQTYFFSLLFFFSNSLIKAEIADPDSLLLCISEAEDGPDKVDLLRKYANEQAYVSQDEAKQYYNKSINLAKELNDTSGIVLASVGLCNIHSMNGEYKRALALIDEATILSKDNSILLSLCHSTIAIEYYNLGFNKLFLEHSLIAHHYDELNNDSLAISYNYNNIGTYYLEEEIIDSAEYYWDLSLLYLGKHDDIIRAYIYDGLGSVEKYRGNLNASLSLLRKAKNLFELKQIDYEVVKEEMAIASVFQLKSDLRSAIRNAKSAYDKAVKISNYSLLKDCSELLSELYEIRGYYRKATLYAREARGYADSVDVRNKDELLFVLDTKHALERNKKILKNTNELNVILSKQRSFLIGFSVLSMILSVMLFFVLYKKNREHKLNKLLVIELDQLNDSMRKILGVIGHDLRDSVGNLKNFTQLMQYKLLDKESIGDLVQRFVPMVNSTHNLLENLLMWSHNNKNDFKFSCVDIDSYKLVNDAVENVLPSATTKNIEIIKQVENTHFCGDPNILQTVLRNLLSNAIKFSDPGSEIRIGCKEKGKIIQLYVSDDGIGMTNDQVNYIMSGIDHKGTKGTNGETGSGLGLFFCSALLKSHQAKLKVESKLGHGSAFVVEIPLKRK